MVGGFIKKDMALKGSRVMKKLKVVICKCLLLCIMMAVCNIQICVDGEEASLTPSIEFSAVNDILPRTTYAPAPHPVEYWDGILEIVPPKKTEYNEGEILDLTGLEVNELAGAKYSDGSSRILQRKALENLQIDLVDKPLSCTDTCVTVSGWAELISQNLSGTFEIVVHPLVPPTRPPVSVYEFSGVLEIVPPYKTEYTEGEFLDINGLEIYETAGTLYSDGSKTITSKRLMNFSEGVIVDLIDKPLSCEDKYVTVMTRSSTAGFVVIGQFEIVVHSKWPYEIGEISICDDYMNMMNENLAVDVEVEKLKNWDTSVTIFAAVYDMDEKMIGLDSVQANLDLNSKSTLTFYIPTKEKAVGKVKAYVWDTMEGMQPLAESKTLDLYSDSTKLKDQEKMKLSFSN